MKQLESAKAKIAKGRDELRAIEEQVDELMDGMDENIESIEHVVDSLSRFL